MKTIPTVLRSIALSLICASAFNYGTATQGQKGSRAPRKPISKAVTLVDEADKLADEQKFPQAIEAYKLAIQVDPNYAPAHGGLGDAYLSRGNWPEALDEYKEQVRLAPNSAQAQYDLGYSYNVMGRHGEAFAPLVKATALDPTFGEAFYEIGYAYLRGTSFDKSIPFFRSAIRLLPDYADAYYGLGLAYARLGKADLANEQLKKLSSLDAKSARKLEKEIPGAVETAEAGRVAPEPAPQSLETETQASAPGVVAKRARVVKQTAPAEVVQIERASPAEPSVSKPSMTDETASRQPVTVRNRQKQSIEPTPLSASNSQAQVNPVRTQPKRANPRNRERSGTISSQDTQQPVGDGDWTEIIRQTMPGVVSIVVPTAEGIASGSGFLVASDGLVVTNYHVIQGSSTALVITKQGEKFEVKGVLSYDRTKDFAILKIPAFDLPVVPLGNSNNIELGESVLAIGDPGGPVGPKAYPETVSVGIISAKAREREGSTWIQTSTPVSHGNSGGPLLNRRAEVIGVISRGENRDGQNFNMAVPINYVRGALQVGAAIRSLPELAKIEAEIARAEKERSDELARAEREKEAEDVRKLLTQYEDPNGVFTLHVPKAWAPQHKRTSLADGATQIETLFAPQSATLAELGGYLSEGIRVNVLLPPPSRSFTSEAIETFKNQIPENLLRTNPGFELTNSGMFLINGLQTKVYTFEGKGPRLSEPEKNLFYVFGNQKALVEIDVVQPLSRVALLDLTNQLAKSFEFRANFNEAGPPPSPGNVGGSVLAHTVTARDLELSFRSNLFDDTIRNATLLLQSTPNSPEGHAYLGLALLFKRDVDNAVLHLEQAILLGQAITLPAKRLREPLLGHGLDDAAVTLTKDSVTIKSGKSVFQAGFSALSESRMGNYNNTCPIAFLKGQFIEGGKGKTSEKGFNLFPPSAGLTPVQQGTLFYNVAACNDDGTMTTAIVKLLYRLMSNTR